MPDSLEPSADDYPCPANHWQCEERFERSRFLVLVHPLTAPENLHRLLRAIRAEHHKATHHCHGWRMGHPSRQPDWGCADDGEPAGTAGLPIFKAIEGSGLSDVLVVVVRWFGGIKLGTGGLARAYGGMAARGLSACPRCIRTELLPLHMRFPYSMMTQVRRTLAGHGAREEHLDCGADVELRVMVPASRLGELDGDLRELFQGQGCTWMS